MKWVVMVLTCGWLVVGVVLGAPAGTIVDVDVIALNAQVENAKATMYFEPGRLRVDQTGEKTHTVIIYRSDLQVVWSIHLDLSTYTEITPNDVKALRAELRDQVEQYEQYLSALPDGEREVVELTYDWDMKVMKRLAEERSWKKFSNEKVGKPVKVGKWTAQKYRRFYDGKSDDIECWAVDWDQTGVTAEDFAVVLDIARNFDQFVGDFFLMATTWSADTAKPVVGFPISFVTWNKDAKMMRTDITAIRKADVDSTLFVLPEGLDRKPFLGTE